MGKSNPRDFWEFFNRLQESTEHRRKLNPLAYRRHGTVEFRIFNSTTDRVSIRGMVDFSRQFVRAVRNGDPKLFRYIYQSKGEISFQRVAELVGSEWGLDFENAMRHIQMDIETALQRNQATDPFDGAEMGTKKKSTSSAWMTLLMVSFAVAGSSERTESQ